MNYYKRHLGDYAKDTRTLNVYEHGVYTVVLDFYYSEEGPVSDDDVEALCRPRTPSERESVDKVMRKYFKRDGKRWRHSYADRVIATAQAKAERNREIGSLGGRPPNSVRNVSRETEPNGITKANPEETQTVISGNPEKTLATSHKPLAISQEPSLKEKKEKDRATRVSKTKCIRCEAPGPVLIHRGNGYCRECYATVTHGSEVKLADVLARREA